MLLLAMGGGRRMTDLTIAEAITQLAVVLESYRQESGHIEIRVYRDGFLGRGMSIDVRWCAKGESW